MMKNCIALASLSRCLLRCCWRLLLPIYAPVELTFKRYSYFTHTHTHSNAPTCIDTHVCERNAFLDAFVKLAADAAAAVLRKAVAIAGNIWSSPAAPHKNLMQL